MEELLKLIQMEQLLNNNLLNIFKLNIIITFIFNYYLLNY